MNRIRALLTSQRNSRDDDGSVEYIIDDLPALEAALLEYIHEVIGEDGKGCTCEDDIGFHTKYCENNGTFYEHLRNQLRAAQRARLEGESK